MKQWERNRLQILVQHCEYMNIYSEGQSLTFSMKSDPTMNGDFAVTTTLIYHSLCPDSHSAWPPLGGLEALVPDEGLVRVRNSDEAFFVTPIINADAFCLVGRGSFRYPVTLTGPTPWKVTSSCPQSSAKLQVKLERFHPVPCAPTFPRPCGDTASLQRNARNFKESRFWSLQRHWGIGFRWEVLTSPRWWHL